MASRLLTVHHFLTVIWWAPLSQHLILLHGTAGITCLEHPQQPLTGITCGAIVKNK